MKRREAHAYNVDEAQAYGLEKSILLQHLRFWCNQNDGKKDCLHDGKVWMFQSAAEMVKHFPYWSRQKIARLLRDMESDGLILSGNFNKIGYDQTKWYTLNLECSNLNNRQLKNNQPIQDNKKDNKKDTIDYKYFEECWVLYERRGNKAKAWKMWQRLSENDKVDIRNAIPKYVKSTPEIRYRKHMDKWINPTYEYFRDSYDMEDYERVSI